MTPATIEDFEEQALQVLSYFNENKSSMFGQPSVVHYNWMARGEPLANPNMLNYAYDIFRALQYYADQMRLTPKFKVSTIMPNEVAEVSLGETFNSLPVDLYYSLYSMDPSFRKRFLPKSLDPNYALSKLASYQAQSGRDITLHWAFIEGENDSEKAVQGVLDAVHKHGLRAKFNLVRYNPPSNRTRESSEEVLNRNFEIIHESLGHEDSRIIPRVGFDVKASCGMFVS